MNLIEKLINKTKRLKKPLDSEFFDYICLNPFKSSEEVIRIDASEIRATKIDIERITISKT